MALVLAPRWSFLLVRGIASVAFGVIALAWPGVTLAALTILFGAYALVDGVTALVVAARRGRTRHRWLLVADGLLGVAAGIATFMWPALTLLVLLFLVGARFFLSGIFQAATAIALRHDLDAPLLYGLSGVASIALGVLTWIVPGVTARVLLTFLGVYAIFFGIAMAILAFRLRRFGRAVTPRFA